MGWNYIGSSGKVKVVEKGEFSFDFSFSGKDFYPYFHVVFSNNSRNLNISNVSVETKNNFSENYAFYQFDKSFERGHIEYNHDNILWRFLVPDNTSNLVFNGSFLDYINQLYLLSKQTEKTGIMYGNIFSELQNSFVAKISQKTMVQSCADLALSLYRKLPKRIKSFLYKNFVQALTNKNVILDRLFRILKIKEIHDFALIKKSENS